MSFDDLKTHHGRKYAGMRVGQSHDWHYPHGHWHETKHAPDEWTFQYTAQKKRTRAAPEGSGAPTGTGYHWFILAHQHVRKVDKDAYDTLMQGLKFKLAHKRPHWLRWSSQYPDQEDERDRVVRVLESVLDRLRQQKGETAHLIPADRSTAAPPQDQKTKRF